VTRRAAARGFTLFEMLFVVLITAVVLTAMINLYLDLTDQTQAALASTRDVRRAGSVLDRIARDLEAATLVKKPEALDPLEHPWMFLAEGRGTAGADRLRFQARNHRPRLGAGHESDLVELAYWLSPSEDGEGFDLLRWASARPPVPPLARTFPRRDDPGVEVLASDVAFFAVRLQDADGAWQSAWDSWSPAQSSLLPIAAEIQLALLPEAPADDLLAEEEPELFARPVVFALDPLDLEKALTGETGDEEEDEEDELACVTVAECVSRNQGLVDDFFAQNPDARGIFDSIADQCWSDHAASSPVPVTNCEE
jgi:type II secretory pathway pseudopilin PulG